MTTEPRASSKAQVHRGAVDPVEALAQTIDRLYREHHATVYRLALRYGSGNEAWAEDIVQDVFLTLLDALPSLHDVDHLGGWLYRVTTNRCLRKLRRDRFLDHPVVHACLGPFRDRAVDPPEAQVFARRDLERTRSVLALLPPKECIVVCMHLLDGKSQVEIGQILGFSKSYACKLLARGMARLQRELR